MLNLMEENSSIAACQPKVKDYYNRSYFEYAGASGGFIDKLGYPFCRGRVFSTLEEDKGQYNNTTEVFWASGACLFIRSDVYQEVEGLDERFFAHMEEIDLCWRIKNKGYKIMVCPSSTVYHVGGGTLDKESSRKVFLNFRNSLLMLHKNLPLKHRIVIIFLRLLLDGVAALRFLTLRKPKHFFAILKAHFSFYSNLSQNKKKRTKNTLFPTKGVINIYIVKDYFIKKCIFFHTLTK